LETIVVLVQYKIKKKKLTKAKDAIYEYVEAIKKDEPRTTEYRVFQDKDDNTMFIHMMSFADKNAKKIHEKSVHLKKLKKILIPISKGKAVYTSMIESKPARNQEKTEAVNNVSSHEPVK
jgi:quinol monooxygenase YgiN